MQTTLTRIFIVLESVSHGLSENSDEIFRKFEGFFRPKSGGLQKKKKKKKKRSSPKLSPIFRPKSEIQRFFPPKNRWSPKKKKVFAEIKSDFSTEIRNSNVFSAQKQVVSKKKEKRSSPKLSPIFRPKSEIQTFFLHKHRWSLKKKVFAERFLSTIFRPNSEIQTFQGGLFSIFTKNRPQKH